MDIIIKTLKSGKKVGFVPMDWNSEKIAAEKAGDASKLAGQIRFVDEQLKLTIREIDGNPANYETLAKLDGVFTYREILELRKHLNDINVVVEENPT